MGLRFGIDLGGTKIEIVALDQAGMQVFRERTPTPTGDYDATIKRIRYLVEKTREETGHLIVEDVPTIGIGIPGTISPATGLIKNANSTCLIGQPLAQDLMEALDQPVRLSNDADCFALSEATDGAGQGHHIVFGVILGTGVGGGLVINQRIIRGPNAITGEWGHNPLPWPDSDLDENPGPDCYCGRTGCIETFLSGPSLVRDYLTHQKEPALRTAKDLVSAINQGDRAAKETLDRYCMRLARSLATTINIIDPDVIVLGGGLSNIKQLYDVVPKLWGAFVFSDTVETLLVPPKHGDSSGVRGAAWLWPSSE